MNHSPTPWYVAPDDAEVWDSDGCLVADCAEARVEGELIDRANANRIVACVNACADIPTESLTALDWQLAPKAGARPIDVAKLLLKMDVYRNAMARLVVQAKACNFTDEEGHQLTMNTAYQAIQEALK